MTSSPAPLTENQCFDVVTDAANLSENNDCSSEHEKDDEDEDEDEEGDVDFNPFLKEALSFGASSSLSSEIEEFDVDAVDSGEKHSPVANSFLTKAPDDLPDHAAGDVKRGEEMVMQTADSSAGACKESSAKTLPTRCNKRKSSADCESDTTTLCQQVNEPNIATNRVTDVTVEDFRDISHCQKLIIDNDDEDAICRRTRARYSLASFTLDELETFLQETDDEDDLHNIDDEQEYRKFLAAVLQGGDAGSGAAQENENVDEEDEDNDADFELEIEEALESDVDESLRGASREREHERVGRRPETRQKKRQKADLQHKKKFSGQTNRPLRPILPYAPIAPSSDLNVRNYMIESTSGYPSSSAKNGYISVFTPQQIGQLHCLIYEHVQLLVQVFSLSILEPSRHHIATEVQGLLSEILHKRDQVLASQRVPYPSFCFNPPFIHSNVIVELPKSLHTQGTCKSSTVDAQRVCSSGNDMMPPFDPNFYQGVSSGTIGHAQSIEGFFWSPFISGPVLSVIDVAPLNLVGSYMDDVSAAVREHQQRQLAVAYDASADKECLFPVECFHSSDEPNGVSPAATLVHSPASDQKPKKTIAAALVERSKKQSIALVPKQIAKLALRFFPLFNPVLFPHKPPPVSIANRVLFTDSEDGLLARGLMKYNNNWKEIQKNFLPCKSAHQIFVRQKNRSCTRAPENPIKAVRRMKTSPLTSEEKVLIEEGLKIYKLDWMSVWKYVVPHRDPSLLARQWRTAIGNQKSYKGDEYTKAKRRLYESGRRKSKLLGLRLQTTGDVQNGQLHDQTRGGWSTEEDVNPVPGSPLPSGVPRWQTSSDKENCSADNAGVENNSGDDGGNNEDETYVHEAFLADWRPGPIDLFVQAGSHTRGLTNNTGPVNSHPQYGHNLLGPNSFSHFTNPVSGKILRSSQSYFHMRPYRARRSDCPRLVKLAPDLPPVNLPPTVRVMSQSAFTKYQDEASSKICTQGSSGPVKENTVSTSPFAVKSGARQNPVRCSTSQGENCHAVEKDDSDLHMHPLLFQAPEDGNLPYYPLNGSAGSSSSFDFFSNSTPQLNLNLFRYSQQAKSTLNFFNNSVKSKELSSPVCGVDFHPLLQRTDDGNDHLRTAPSIPHQSADSSMPFAPHQNSTSSPATVGVPPSPNELDLDIRLSFTNRKEKGGEGMTRSTAGARESGNTETRPSGSRNEHKIANEPDSGARSIGTRNDVNDCSREQVFPEIVMEQEELSDSEDEEAAERVEFECEEMTDSEGEGGSDSDHVDNAQNEDVQDDSLPKVVAHEDTSDQDEPRWHNTSKADLVAEKFHLSNPEKDEPSSSLGLSLNPYAPPLAKSKLPVTRNCRSSHASRSSKTTSPPQPQPRLDSTTQVKKPRKRTQKLDPR